MNVRKRGLALLMCICMIFTLLPFSAFADASSDKSVVYGQYVNGPWTQVDGMTADSSAKNYKNDATGADVTYSKTAVSKGSDTYDVTLKIESKTSSTAPGASAVVLVMDISTSMYFCTECGNQENHNEHCSKSKGISGGPFNKHGSEVKTEDTRLYAAKNAAVNFVNSYKGNIENAGRYIQLVAFDGYAYKKLSDWIDVSVAANSTKAIAAINGLTPPEVGNGTNLEQGLSKAKELITSAPDGIAKDKKFAVVLTDGEPNCQGRYSISSFVKSKTDAAASSLRSAASVYTVCFGAADKKSSYLDNMTVGEYLSGTVASNPNNAFNANSAAELNKAFEDIFKSIEQGLDSGFTVTDPMGEFIQLDESSIKDATAKVNGNTITWTPTAGEVSEKDGVKTYTYTLTYTVKLDTSANGFVDNKYYATNDVTTLAFKDGDDNITRDFNVPGVKGTAPKYKVTYEYTGTVPTGAPALPGEVSYKAGDTVKVADAPTLAGYEFSGWTTSDANITTGSFTMPSNKVTLTGSWALRSDLSYTVHYYWNGTNESVKADNVVTGQTFNTIVTEKPATVNGYTPVSADSKTITIGTDTNANVITFYYYKNVELVANSATYPFDNTAKTVSDYKAYSTEDTAKETELNITFNGVTATRTETLPGTYDVTFTGTTVGAKDTSDKYIVTKATDGKLIINPAYQIIYEYKNAPENAPTCPVDNTYYVDGTTVSPLKNPGTLDGYIFSGWKINGEGDAVTGVTFAGANIKLIGEWKPVTGLTCTINYIWNGNKTTPIRTDTIDGLTYNEVVTKFPMEIPGYTPVSNNSQEIIVKTTGNVINFYYYKNVTLESNSGKFTYNGKDHSVSGYDVITKADNGKDVKVDAEFIGVSASRTEKDVGSYPVTFKFKGNLVDKEGLIGKIDSNLYYIVSDVKEGTLTIEKIKDEVTVKITGNTKTVTYNGKEHNVTGYATDVGDKPITVALKDGKVAEAKGTDVGTYYMQLTAADFVVTSDIYANIKVIVEDGWLKINRRPMPPVNPPITDKITVEITGNSDSVVYDGIEHSVKDYTVKISDSRYTEKDFTFSGKALASGVNAGTYEMGLKADQFKNTNARFRNVEFIIKADGVLTITQRPLTITAGSAEGIAPVTCDKYTVEGLATGDKVDSVKITGIQSEPGESPNVASDAVIKNAKGEDVTANYKITYVNGVLKAIEVLNKEIHFNYVIGYTDGTIRPSNNISRAEVATIFFRLLTDEARTQYDKTTSSFSDIKDGAWCCRAVSTLTNMGIIKGYTDGTFRPNADITRAELATIIARFAKLDVNTETFSDINGHWAQKSIELAAGNGWINGYTDGTFRPNKSIIRAETFAMINRVLDRQTESVSDLLPTSEMNMWSDNLNENAWYYKDVQEATNYHKCDRVGDSVYEKWTEKVPDIDWASYQI